MNTTYIQFDAPTSKTSKDGVIKSSLKKVLVNVLTKVLPLANPDFEDKIDEVIYWLVEFETETGIPQREIGIDAEARGILKMPYKNNYGYWTDNNLLLNDFKEHFNVSEISKESFEKQWDIFDKITAYKLELTNYSILTTGAGGGTTYLTTEIDYKGDKRKLVIYFADKSDEQKVKPVRTLKLTGRLFDQGIQQSLSLLDTKIND
ncbi:MAG: hypothetical protein RJA07_1247 [Bacteroidota bacterium]|jgi:hypothetical protein